MDLVSRAFPSAKQSSKVTLIDFNYDDQTWADAIYRPMLSGESDFFRSNYQNLVIDSCQTSRKACWSASGFTLSSGDGIIVLGVVEQDKLVQLDSSYSSMSRSSGGLTVAHEYFHVVQRKIIDRNWFQMGFAPPTWFHEASAVFVENSAMNYDSYEKYMRFRAVDSKLAYPSCGAASQGCIPVTEAIMLDFLSLSHYSNNWSNFPYGMKYEVSMRTIEVLVALKGHESITDVYSYMEQNHTFEEAFLKIYGITYSSAIPVLAKIVSEQFANNR